MSGYGGLSPEWLSLDSSKTISPISRSEQSPQKIGIDLLFTDKSINAQVILHTIDLIQIVTLPTPLPPNLKTAKLPN
ncbi:hypothetical protein [Paraburkholderia megapolitana]|uniref:hypothetical protein n=1 Tax=Paraburkholderia megapolitana TaxID=420953 RepID=UPI0038BAF584